MLGFKLGSDLKTSPWIRQADQAVVSVNECQGRTKANHSFSSLSMMISNTSYGIGPDCSFLRSALMASSHSWSAVSDQGGTLCSCTQSSCTMESDDNRYHAVLLQLTYLARPCHTRPALPAPTLSALYGQQAPMRRNVPSQRTYISYEEVRTLKIRKIIVCASVTSCPFICVVAIGLTAKVPELLLTISSPSHL